MYDYLVIGGGIVGLATARELQTRNPGASILLLEKEQDFAKHQTGRNSGVIHAGVYYAPGSLKARFCKVGREETIVFCEQHGINYEVTGKLLVATNDLEVQRAKDLIERCRENGIESHWLDEQQLKDREPHVFGKAAIYVPSTGIADYGGMVKKMAELFCAAGGETLLGEEVLDLSEQAEHVDIVTNTQHLKAKVLVACAGLQADRLAHKMGLGKDFRIVPFRGEYYGLNERWNDKFSHLIYPIPDPDLPFLGVHLTKMIDGRVTVGPNAVLGFAREGYGKLAINLKDMIQTFGFSGFWKSIWPNLRSGIDEFANSLSKRRYLELCRKYCPELQLSDLESYPTGIRAQAVWRDGRMEHDFLILNSKRAVHVCNAPSPAATSALPIARHVVDQVEERLKSIN